MPSIIPLLQVPQENKSLGLSSGLALSPSKISLPTILLQFEFPPKNVLNKFQLEEISLAHWAGEGQNPLAQLENLIALGYRAGH